MKSSRSAPAEGQLLPNSTVAKSLTPQRKHRKLLKDGTSEVWPEEVEKIFVEGLHQYWDSPWATYSRGRSRWRNQFLVEFLQRAGIERSKKQVASHIQVLRNMWKGEPEYHLVAGGEELFSETIQSEPIKSEEIYKPRLSPVVKLEDNANLSPLSHPSYSIFAPETTRSINSEPSDDDSCGSVSSSESVRNKFTLRLPHSDSAARYRYDLPQPMSSSSCPQPMTYLTNAPITRDHRLARANWSSAPSSPVSSISKYSQPSDAQPCNYIETFLPLAERVTSTHMDSTKTLSQISLWAEGMQPLIVQPDTLFSVGQSITRTGTIVILQIRLHLPTIDSPHSPTIHGFQGSITYNARPGSAARCFTYVYAANSCISKESGYCQIIDMQPSRVGYEIVTAQFPDSSLSRGRWLDASLRISIVQRIAIDEEISAVIMYDLDRNCDMPSSELVAYQKHSPYVEKSSLISPNDLQESYASPVTPDPSLSRSDFFPHTSLSSSLTAAAVTSNPIQGCFPLSAVATSTPFSSSSYGY